MNQLQVTARCKIHDGRLEDFRAAAAECLRSVRENDRGTRQYDWFFNSHHTVCIVRETYDDSNAVLQHIANMGEAFPNLLSTCDLSLEIYGDPSPELMEASEGIPYELFSFFQGI